MLSDPAGCPVRDVALFSASLIAVALVDGTVAAYSVAAKGRVSSVAGPAAGVCKDNVMGVSGLPGNLLMTMGAGGRALQLWDASFRCIQTVSFVGDGAEAGEFAAAT